SCGSGGYSLTIIAHDDGSVAKGVRYELFVIRGDCPLDLDPNHTPDEASIAVQDSWTMTGTPSGVVGTTLRKPSAGHYRFLARVRRPEDCAVRWSACARSSIQLRGTGRIELSLSPVEGKGCDDGMMCNGKETCVDFACRAGTPLSCPSGQECLEPRGCAPIA